MGIDNGMFFIPMPEQRARINGMRVMVLVPCGDYKSPIRWVSCMANMIAYSAHFGLKLHAFGYTERTVVDWARNSLAERFLKTKDEYEDKPFTHALWLDDDHVFNPDLAVRLAANSHLDMVSALYHMRTAPYHPVAYLKDDSDNEFKHWPLTKVPPAVAEVDAVGFGALLMRREVLEGTPKPWFTLDWRSGEDIAFCVQAKKAGFKVWLDGEYAIGHIGHAPIVTAIDCEKYMAEHPEDYKNLVRVKMFEANNEA